MGKFLWPNLTINGYLILMLLWVLLKRSTLTLHLPLPLNLPRCMLCLCIYVIYIYMIRVYYEICGFEFSLIGLGSVLGKSLNMFS
ncbi:hypothetical protein Hanom_Chr01g00018281 [Helianthus anomalus]